MLSYFLFILILAADLFLCFLVYLKGRQNRINRLFSALTFWSAVWMSSNFLENEITNLELAILFLTIDFISGVLIAYFFLLFCLYFHRPNLTLSKIKIFLIFSPIVILTIFILSDLIITNITLYQGRIQFSWGKLSIFYILTLLGYIGTGCLNLIFKYKKSYGIQKLQTLYILTGLSLTAFLALIINFFLQHILPVSLFRIGIYGFLFFIGFTSYAIVKYRLMDIRVVISKSLLYALLVVYVAGAFTFVSLLAVTYLHQLSDFNETLITLLISLIIVLSLDPLKKYLGRITDKIFFKARINYQDILVKLSEIISYELDLQSLLDEFLSALAKELKIEEAYILLSDKNKSFFRKENYLNGRKIIDFDQKSYLVKFLKRNKEIIISDELERKIIDADGNGSKVKKELEKIKSDLEKFNAAFCAPIFTKGRLTGILFLGKKLSGDMYAQEDINLFEVLSPQLAAALEKAKLYQEVHHFSQKLKLEVEKATEDLKKVNERLKKLDQIKTEFISITSHQLRTPLSGLKGYLSMLLEGDFGELDEKKTEVISDLLQNTERLVRLVNLFLNVSRIEMGKFSLEKSKVDLDKLIEETIKEFMPDINKKNLKVEFKKAAKSNLLFVDRDKIKDVVLNLLDNAIKYTDKGKITIEINFENNLCHFSISDTGIGIKKDDLDKLFGKFTRGSIIPDISKTGSGLGLFIAKKNIEAHNGKIWAESEGEGKGSRFCFEVGI
ncbi:MAG: hypothetical protein Athens101410_633 [Parcubacteria group bacterium Athens1014_10]|nr:MAG: hypothetical protein Athens101410_633 [Parcubacteria group bacterium Athens1014_10]TSD04818.1 MAG: hypothetical protein Athens071412_602 [Parcubacteria group bacterium Athens0714_12]